MQLPDLSASSHIYLIRIILGVFLSGLSCLHAQNERLVFDKYNVGDGLPDNSVRVWVQDHLGYIWLGTQRGLVKYDGYEFQHVSDNSGDSVTLYLKNIRSMIADQNGNLWIGTPFDGLDFYHRQSGTFTHFGSLKNGVDSTLGFHNIFFLHEDRKGDIWVYSRNSNANKNLLSRIDKKQNKIFPFRHDPLDSLSISKHFITAYNSMANNQYAFYEDSEGIIWIGTRGDGLQSYNRQTNQFHHFRHQSYDSTSLSNDTVYHIMEDPQNRLWIATINGLNEFDRKAGSFKRHYHVDENNAPFCENIFVSIFPATEGEIWVAGLGEIHLFNHQQGFYKSYKMAAEGASQNEKHINTLIPLAKDHSGNIWLASSGKRIIYHFNPKSEHFSSHTLGIKGPLWMAYLTQLSVDQFGQAWIGSLWKGLIKENRAHRWFSLYQHQPDDTGSLPDNKVRSICGDQEGDVWVGTAKGLVLYDPENNNFKNKISNGTALPKVNIKSLYADSKGNLWIGTIDSGLFKLELETGRITHFYHNPKAEFSLSDDQITKIYEDSRGYIWVVLLRKGLNRLDPGTEEILNFSYIPGDSSSLSYYIINDVLEDSNGDFWVATLQGLNRFNYETNDFTHFLHDPTDSTSLSNNQLVCLYLDKEGSLWIGTDDGGLNLFHSETETFSVFPIHPLPMGISGFFEDKKGGFWMGTFINGLYQLNKEDFSFHHYGTADRKYDGQANNLTEDEDGNFWFSTRRGVSSFNPNTKSFTHFDHGDGLQDSRLWDNRIWNVLYKCDDGYIWLGGDQGVNRFHPKDIQPDLYPPLVHINGLKIGTKALSEIPSLPLDKPLEETHDITLKHHQNDLSFDFVALHFLRPEKNLYSWKMENYEEDWTEPSTQRHARYTNLSPGAFTFRVKACNADGTWNEEGTYLHITILPPWWATWWARTLFAILFISLVVAIYRYQLGRKLEHAENLRLKELDEAKTQLYTNITHEFRTPLTVILGMVDQIREKPRELLKEGLPMIERNAGIVLRLINQMLNLAKLEAGSLKADLRRDDIIPFLKYLLEATHSLAEAKGLELRFQTDLETFEMDYDPEKIEVILSNLLSNAIKFTDEGRVSLKVAQVNNEALSLQVVDTGRGIPAEKLPHIFDRFYQVQGESTRQEGGTGIGLALVKEMVQFLGGEIKVQSEYGKGSTFSVVLPVSRHAERNSFSQKPAPKPSTSKAASEHRSEALGGKNPLLLIVEDNKDVQTYLKGLLQDAYQIAFAKNGEEGLEKSRDLIPDLILSDVMMPVMDGFQLCKKLKTDLLTSHIPVILLTAKADQASKVSGLRYGADAYMEKPFDKEELFVRLEKLLELRRSLQAHYASFDNIMAAPEPEPAYPLENEFLLRLNTIMEQHLEDENFGILEICQEIGMSRSQLHRKLKALTGKPTTHYLRSIRLWHARQLLLTTDINISQVAYKVGYKHPTYFTRLFIQEFGIKPSQIRS